MEKTMSVDEKIRRAEEIYYRRKGENEPLNRSQKPYMNIDEKKDVKLLKKMIIQMIFCVIIYGIVYIIQNNQFIFSEDFINKANEILSYDTNFMEIYENIKNGFATFQKNFQIKQNDENTINSQNTEAGDGNESNNQTIQENAIGGAVEEKTQEKNEEQQLNEEQGTNKEETTKLTQEEQDINNIKATTTFIKPIEGIISSKYGYRQTATGKVPKNHTGTDIAANLGTKIKSATEGEVVLSSEEGDYGKHLKIQIGEVAIIYAHCNQLYVKQGEHVSQGQEIAEVGSTGNSTGPHLHFEIRYQERIIDPQKILEI